MITKIAMLLMALVTGAGGVYLAQFAEADDSPGGVVIGMVVVISAVVLGVMALRPTAGSRQRD